MFFRCANGVHGQTGNQSWYCGDVFQATYQILLQALLPTSSQSRAHQAQPHLIEKIVFTGAVSVICVRRSLNSNIVLSTLLFILYHDDHEHRGGRRLSQLISTYYKNVITIFMARIFISDIFDVLFLAGKNIRRVY